MKRILLIFTVLVSVVALWIVKNSMMPTAGGLQTALYDELQQPVGTLISISDYTRFEWDTFCVFGGYTSKSRAEAVMGLEWPYFWFWMTHDGDRRYVFLKNEELVATFNRTSDESVYIDAQNQCVTRDESILEVGIVTNPAGDWSMRLYHLAENDSG